MIATDLLLDGFDRVRQTVHKVLDGIDDDALSYRPDADANPIAWLVWHLSRVQDDHIAGVAGTPQIWTSEGWHDRFDLPLEATDIGYGHDSQQVASVRAGAADLLGYHDAVHARTADYLAGLTEDDFARVVDPNWDPPVTLAVRVLSVLNDDLQHAGQAAYVRGLTSRR